MGVVWVKKRKLCFFLRGATAHAACGTYSESMRDRVEGGSYSCGQRILSVLRWYTPFFAGDGWELFFFADG